MKLLEFILFVLGNQRGSLDLGEDNGDALDDASLDDLGADDSFDLDDFDDLEEDGQPEEETPEELSLEEQLDQLKGEDQDTSNLLEQINNLGIIRKGLPVEFEDMEKVKEMLGQGFDYTQKTMELAEQRKSFEAEIAQQKSEIEKERQAFQDEKSGNEQVLQTYPILTQMISDIQANDPELFDEMNQYFLRAEQSIGRTNPMVSEMDKRFKALEEKLEGANKQAQEKQLEDIRNGWEKELTETQASYGPKLRTLGIRPDWAKVKEAWAADTKGEMTVKQALFAVHGEKIQAALESQAKLAKTKSTASRLGVTKQEPEGEETVFGMESGDDYLNFAMKEAGLA